MRWTALGLVFAATALQACGRGPAPPSPAAARTALPGWGGVKFGAPVRPLLSASGSGFQAEGDEYSARMQLNGQTYRVTILGLRGLVQQIAYAPEAAGQAADRRRCAETVAPVRADIVRLYGQPDGITAAPPELGAGEVSQWRFADGAVIVVASYWSDGACRASATFSGPAIAGALDQTGATGNATNPNPQLGVDQGG